MAGSGRSGSAQLCGRATAASAGAATWIPAAVAGVVLLCFAPAWRCDFIVNWDDDLNFLNNPLYRGLSLAHLRWMFSTFHGGHYQPLSWLTLAVDYRLWGMQPRGYHLTNVILHTINAVLVYAVALALLRRAPGVPPTAPAAAHRNGRALGAAVAALSFAIHPLRVESVAWVTERRDVLSTCFLLLTVLAYFRTVEARPAGPWRKWLGVCLGCFVLSLLSKAWGMTLPVVLLVLDAYPLRRFAGGRGNWRVILIEKLPFLLLAGMAMTVAVLAQLTVAEMHTLGQHGVAARAMQAAYGVLFYLWKTLVPVGLSPLYPLRPDFDPTALPYVLCGFAVCTVTLILLWMRRRWPWALAAWACYIVILSPVLGFLQTGPQLVADRYTYIACIPWALLAGAAIARLPGYAERASRRPLRRQGLLSPSGTIATSRTPIPFALRRPHLFAAVSKGIISAALLVLAVLTVRQTRIWTNAFTLWDHALRIAPTNYVAAVNRGWLQLQRGDAAGALAYYEAALQANPRFALAYRDRALVRHQRGDLRGAIADYTTALELEPLAATYLNRGLARQALGEADAALDDYSAALRLNPNDPQAYNNRGWLRRQRGELTAAIDDFDSALRVAPPAWPYRTQTADNLQETRAQAGGQSR